MSGNDIERKEEVNNYDCWKGLRDYLATENSKIDWKKAALRIVMRFLGFVVTFIVFGTFAMGVGALLVLLFNPVESEKVFLLASVLTAALLLTQVKIPEPENESAQADIEFVGAILSMFFAGILSFNILVMTLLKYIAGLCGLGLENFFR